jgi:hypothetical protein
MFLFFHRASFALPAALILGVDCTRATAVKKTRTPLFDGRVDGFAFHLGNEGADDAGTFTVKDGTIICTGRPAGYMYTKKRYSRYTLEYDWAFERPAELRTTADFGAIAVAWYTSATRTSSEFGHGASKCRALTGKPAISG